MNEVNQLERALEKLSTCRDWERRSLEKTVLMWSSRTHGHIATLESLLSRQLDWLDSHEGHAAYEERFADWLSNLRLYQRACDALDAAEALKIGVAA